MANGVVYDGWCLEDAHLLNSPDVTLYSSYATNLPANLATYTDATIPAVVSNPALLGQPIPWDKLNYLLNHKPAAAGGDTVAQETQAAVKLLIYGANTNPVLSAAGQAAVDAALADANANGSGFVPAPGQIIVVILAVEGITGNNANFQEAVIELTVPPYYDHGDLPASYPTLNSASGPIHLVGPGLYLGQCVDAETDGQPDAAALGDDSAVTAPRYGTCTSTDDEDGVVRTLNVKWQTVGSVDVTVGAGSGCLSGWIDWDNDGNLTTAGDLIVDNVLLNVGTSTRTFPIPVAHQPANGMYYARFRLYPTDQGGVCTTIRTPTGQALGGEVEDYRWTFGPNAVTLSSMSASSAASRLPLVLGVVIALSVLIGGVVLARRPA